MKVEPLSSLYPQVDHMHSMDADRNDHSATPASFNYEISVHSVEPTNSLVVPPPTGTTCERSKTANLNLLGVGAQRSGEQSGKPKVANATGDGLLRGMSSALQRSATQGGHKALKRGATQMNGMARRYENLNGRSGTAPMGRMDAFCEEEDEDELFMLDWSIVRRVVSYLLMSHGFEMFGGGVIISNFVTIALETDARAVNIKAEPGSDAYVDSSKMLYILYVFNMAFLAFYTVECLLRFYVMRMKVFTNSWDIFDMSIVTMGIIGEILEASLGEAGAEAMGPLRALRNVRLLRASRLLISFHELHSLVCGVTHCMRTLMWAAGLIFMILTMWSIIAVENLQPLMEELSREGHYDSCAWCPGAFETILKANLTLFQVISGDGWSTLSRPLIEKHPWTAIIIMGVILTMLFGLLNLVTAVIVDTAARARMEDIMKVSEQKDSERRKAWKVFAGLCKQLDCDGNGDIDKAEMVSGITQIPELAAYLSSMGMVDDDLVLLMDMLDGNGDGVISHVEFATRLYKMKTQEERTGICVLKYLLEDVRKHCKELLKLQSEALPAPSVVEQVLCNGDGATLKPWTVASGVATSCQAATSESHCAVSNPDSSPSHENRLCGDQEARIAVVESHAPLAPSPFSEHLADDAVRKHSSIESLPQEGHANAPLNQEAHTLQPDPLQDRVFVDASGLNSGNQSGPPNLSANLRKRGCLKSPGAMSDRYRGSISNDTSGSHARMGRPASESLASRKRPSRVQADESFSSLALDAQSLDPQSERRSNTRDQVPNNGAARSSPMRTCLRKRDDADHPSARYG